jgi:hypothetical protein
MVGRAYRGIAGLFFLETQRSSDAFLERLIGCMLPLLLLLLLLLYIALPNLDHRPSRNPSLHTHIPTSHTQHAKHSGVIISAADHAVVDLRTESQGGHRNQIIIVDAGRYAPLTAVALAE